MLHSRRRHLPVQMPPRVGIWGTFDVANYGDLLFPRIFTLEVERRLPGATVRAYSPRGHLHPVPMSRGLRVEPLGRPTSRRRRQLAGELEVVVIGGGEIIHERDDLYALWYELERADADRLRPSEFFVDGVGRRYERTTPTAWHAVGIPFDLEGDLARRVRQACSRRAYVSVRDERSRERLRAIGVDGEIALVPDSAIVVDRLFARSELRARRARLVARGAYPRDVAPLAVQGGGSLLEHAGAMGRALAAALADEPDIPVVLLETGVCHRDDAFADVMSGYLGPRRCFRLPERFEVGDIVAAIASSRGFVGSSLHGSITAYVYGRPFRLIDLHAQSKIAGFVELVGTGGVVSSLESVPHAVRAVLQGTAADDRQRTRLRALVDEHFDRICQLAGPDPGGTDPHDAGGG